VVTSTANSPSPGGPRPQQLQPANADGGNASGSFQTVRKISVPLVPPNPNEFDMATLIFIGRAVFGT
jgi:hypothetical protein